MTPGVEWTLNDAFRYLTLDIGMRDDSAAHEIMQALQAGRLPSTCRRFVGKLISEGPVPTVFWGSHLMLAAKNGELELVYLRALDLGDWTYSVRPADVRMLWDAPMGATASTASAETKCRNHLAALMNESRQKRPKQKPVYRAECVARFKGLTSTAFNRAWTDAIRIARTGGVWDRRGAPKKSD